MDLKQRFDFVKTRYGLRTDRQLADFLGVTAGSISQWKNGDVAIGEKGITAILKRTPFNPLWIQTGEGDTYLKENEITPIGELDVWDKNTKNQNEDYVFVPFYEDVKFVGGNGDGCGESFTENAIAFSRAELRRQRINPNDVRCFNAEGDSMADMIRAGSTIAIDQADVSIKDGKIYAFEHGGKLRIKYLSRLPFDEIEIRSHNLDLTRYPVEKVSISDIKVHGRVFWVSNLL